ncbi:choline dehydrogenase [Photobacterium sp. 2_MG-2023]|uniref:GMC family oxidoreductase n=1 Tax=Photobacterium sp. 2_MG-2023 TaxID=3062663 RepID=UPI0026E35120|nr:choline dehydrogenase [Photobacterium sp. 2_MG-2023]MDO6581541.1 choline dehydrogenase [Photobacterium sp. 2_MG-2023]
MKSRYDYIVVGAGSAGCVLANRLTADGKYSVLVLEAGPSDKTPVVSTPGAFAYFMFSRKYNWAYNATSNPALRNGQPVFVPRGKVLGGSSSVNAMLYVRGQKEDYDHWSALGNSGWGFDDLLPYFKKSECNERGADAFHGDSGPLHVSDRQAQYPLTEAFIQASQQAGFKFNPDFNGAAQEGVGYYQCTIKNGQRCGAARGYLHPAMERKNLTVLTEATVKKVVIEDKKAIGVSFAYKGQELTFHADQEVILSGGAINSPQLLMLSGIGDQDHLAAHGIDCQHHLPGVGENLQEHVDACILVKSKKKDGFTASLGGLLRMTPDTLKYVLKKEGKLSNSITEAGGFIKSREDLDRPDIQLHMLPLLFDDSGRDLKLMAQHGYSCHVCVLRPKSSGTVKLRSADPAMAPDIDFNFFAHEEDKKVLVDGIRQLRKILAAPAFDGYRAEELNPGIEADTDEAIFDKIKQHIGLVYHPVGTCKMGHDAMAVVDTELKVYGVKGLRVVDASVMPTLISGNTNAPTIAIAEKAAELILNRPASHQQQHHTDSITA